MALKNSGLSAKVPTSKRPMTPALTIVMWRTPQCFAMKDCKTAPKGYQTDKDKV